MTKQGEQEFIKASNVLLEPFSPLKRGKDPKAEKALRMPPNHVGVRHRTGPPLLSLTEFCKKRNIPFNENEQRYYMRLKQGE